MAKASNPADCAAVRNLRAQIIAMARTADPADIGARFACADCTDLATDAIAGANVRADARMYHCGDSRDLDWDPRPTDYYGTPCDVLCTLLAW